MNDRLLIEATVQELHLELLRRTRFNAFDGEDIHEDLLAMPDLWHAVLLDAGGLSATGGGVGLIKLRDMAGNYYNVDTLYILAIDARAAQSLAEYAECWLADTVHIARKEETSRSLGSYDTDYRLVSMWWD